MVEKTPAERAQDDGSSTRLPLGSGDALLLVDLQRDFLPGGSLAVPDGDAILAPVNACIKQFTDLRLPVYASRDWHPPQHCSFREQGGPWPPHCVANTPGAAFADSLRLPAGVGIVSKASTQELDAYSAFSNTALHAGLLADGVRRLFVAGLATDYCVLSTVSDALALGYAVVVLRDGVAAVDAQPGDGARALERMRAAGAVLADSAGLLN